MQENILKAIFQAYKDSFGGDKEDLTLEDFKKEFVASSETLNDSYQEWADGSSDAGTKYRVGNVDAESLDFVTDILYALMDLTGLEENNNESN